MREMFKGLLTVGAAVMVMLAVVVVAALPTAAAIFAICLAGLVTLAVMVVGGLVAEAGERQGIVKK
jgi:hypothetical protein